MDPQFPGPGQVLNHFRLVEQIGHGGMGVVFRAYDERLERDVAVKVLHPKMLNNVSSRRRFRREALMLSRLNHPNVEAVYDFNSEGGIDYLILEYVPGVSLDERLRAGPLPEMETITLALQLARGLSAAHAQKIIHRDLKPGNLRMTPEGVLKILDFGLAQLAVLPQQGALAETETTRLRFAGTLPYCSPEQLLGREADVRSDIYSAGAVLYELVTGSRPFPHDKGLIEAIIKGSPPLPHFVRKGISAGFETVILKCMETEPLQRYQSSEELMEQLSRIEGGHISGSTLLRSSVRLTFRKYWPVFASAVVLAAILIALFHKIPHSISKAQPRVMAVLPFDALGQDRATNALGLGLTETLATRLVEASQDDGIQLVSPHELRDKMVRNASEARREFGTDLVLEGTIQRVGDTLRITCNLVDSKTARQVAARTFTRDATDIFGLQDEVVNRTIEMLPAEIAPQRRRDLARLPGTQPPAYEAFIRGRGYLQEYQKPENIDKAIEEFSQALKIDPDYAPAYAGLGEAYWIGFQQPMNRGKEWLTEADRNCEKSLALNQQVAEGRICLGNVSFGTGKYEEAVEQYKRALDLNQNSDDALEGLAAAYAKLGELSKSEAAFKKAIALRPTYWGVYSWLGEFYVNQARYSEAVDAFSKAIDMAPGNYRGYANLSAVYVYEGRYSEAIEASNRSIDLSPNRDALANLGAAYFLQHHFAEAEVTFRRGLQFDDRDPLDWGNLGDALYWIPGRRTESEDAYRKAVSLAHSQLEVNPRDANPISYIAEYSAMLGDTKTALASTKAALALAPNDPVVMFRAALVFNHFHDDRSALAWLGRAAKAGLPRPSIRDTPDFDHLRNNPEFLKLTMSP
jgi:eukaryotic-like serine/threonine-protein kinase